MDGGEREESLGLGAAAGQAEAVAVLLGAELGFDQGAEACRVDEGDGVDVDGDDRGTGRLGCEHGGVEEGRGREVELALSGDHEAAVALDGRDGEQIGDRRSLAFCPLLAKNVR